MAHLAIEADLLMPGSWVIRSDHPAALAGVSDAIVQTLGLQGEALGTWCVHYDEQDHHAEDAYVRERQELGMHAQAQIVVRPTALAQRNVVYLDRLHLVAIAGPPTAGSRLAGMYVGSGGRDPRSGGDLVISVHHPSVAHQVWSALMRNPEGGDALRTGHELVADSRFVLSVDRREPTSVR
ncbi:MAG: hypothetical protein H7287_03950, partial [Thermoleophilia bacterium]|nr:hypothetical protein [Thermoleophilia bacterium]